MPGRISAVAGSKGGPSDNGIVTPGQTTVNSEKRQFSTGLTFDELVKKYGAKQQGKGPWERDIQVPESAQGKYIYNVNRFSNRLKPTEKPPKFSGSSLSGAPQSGGSTDYDMQNGQNVNPQSLENGRKHSTGLTFDELVQKYGAKQQGKGPRERGIAVPESAQGKYVYNINEFWQRANKRKSHPNERLFPFGRSNTG